MVAHNDFGQIGGWIKKWSLRISLSVMDMYGNILLGKLLDIQCLHWLPTSMGLTHVHFNYCVPKQNILTA